MDYRVESDSLGEVKIPKEVLWGPQTQRSLQNFKIGTEKMPPALIKSLLLIKKACAKVNSVEENLSVAKSNAIVSACDWLLNQSSLMEHFPLCLWQTGSGTQTNMNVNEVITTLANQQISGERIQANDDVNRSQSSNDVFPTAINIVSFQAVKEQLLPELDRWIECLLALETDNQAIVKVGRTHLQDATPLTFAEEISGWRTMIERSREALIVTSQFLLKLPIGGTAVGNGINASETFGQAVSQELAEMYGYPFTSDENKFYGLTSYQNVSVTHGAIRSLAADVMKIANDIRWLASGPRGGIGEITIPNNEPGSSIMPGKVNPTQAEALTMVVTQVMGNDTTIQVAASQGNFELNVYKPVIVYNFLQSARLLADAMASFREKCLSGVQANQTVMRQLREQSLMVVTALTPHIGYQKSAKIAQFAYENNLTIIEAALQYTDFSRTELQSLLGLDEKQQ